jgi:hypothetical protein
MIEELTVSEDGAEAVKGGPTSGRGLFTLSTARSGPEVLP